MSSDEFLADRQNERLQRIPFGKDELYAFAAISICLGGVIGGKALAFTAASALVLIFDFKLLFSQSSVLGKPKMLPLFLFVLIHLISGLMVSVNTFTHLLIQLAIVAAFAVPFSVRYSIYPMARFNRAFGIGVIAIVALLVAWHISNGFLVGWKRLGETKTTLSLLPIVLLAFVSANKRSTFLSTAFICVTILIVLFSGERKAYFTLAIALLFLCNFRNPLIYIAGFAAVALLPIVAALEPTGYVQKQLNSALALTGGEVETTLSNEMREWQFNYAMQLFQENPLFGVGTRNYVDTMTEAYGSSKSDIIAPGLTLHGDALRVLVENGLIGASAWAAMLIFASFLAAQSNSHSKRGKKLSLLTLAAMLLFVGFEAYDTTMMIIYWILPTLGALRLDSLDWRAERQKMDSTRTGDRRLPPSPKGIRFLR